MEALNITLAAYALTIVLALLIACAIPALGWTIKKLRLDRDGETLDLSVPSSNSLKEEEAIAVAIAAARARQK